MTPRVIAFMPIYNQEAQVGAVLDRFAAILEAGTVDEVLAVDDGSTDRTPEILAACDYCTVITHPVRLGIGDGIRSAYRYALEHEYDVFVIMAGNGKDDPAEIPRLLEPVLSDRADYVQGSRFLEGGLSAGLPPHRTAAIHLFTLTFSLLVGRRITDCTNGFRAYRTSILRDPRIEWTQSWLRTYELEYYVHYKVIQSDYRVIEVPVSKIYRPSPDGSYSKMRGRDWLIALKPLFYLRLGLRS